MSSLSVAIITLNEERNLTRTLSSISFADEIVLVDSGSTDGTVSIAMQMGARVIERDWPGFAAQKNFAIGQCTGDWVLSLDADEELSPELATEIRLLLERNPAVNGFWLKRRNLFLGRWIRHGGYYPDRKLRLFRRTSAAQFGERAVHETIAFQGETATLDGNLIHHSYPMLADYLEHMQRYSSLGAEVLVGRGRISRSWIGFYWNVLLVPYFTFCWNYLCRLGFLDGREGLLLHLYHSVYVSWKYSKAWETGRVRSGTQVSEARPGAPDVV